MLRRPEIATLSRGDGCVPLNFDSGSRPKKQTKQFWGGNAGDRKLSQICVDSIFDIFTWLERKKVGIPGMAQIGCAVKTDNG